jgi:DNA-directed RNA polymerase subunit RPC12/RpoP
MSPAVLEREAQRALPLGSRGPLAAAAGVTLESVITSAWEDLSSHKGVGCPVCGGRMAPRYGASGLAPVGGRCTDCGSVLG